MTSLSIVIVNYRTASLVVDCLRSLAGELVGKPRWQVVVVDNASGDGSAERIAAAIESEGWSGWARLLPLDHNPGFAGGNNAALRPILHGPTPPDYVLLLNPDTVVRPGAVRELVAFMKAHPDVGIAGSRLEEPDGTPQRCAFRFPSAASELEEGLRLGIVSRLVRHRVVAPPVRDEAHQTDWVAGASMIVRREVFDEIGLMDDGYFLYFEEVDFCLRARRLDWACWYVPASRVVHLVGQASGVTDVKRPMKRRPRYWFESRSRYFQRNHGRAYKFLADLSWLFGFSLWRLRRRIQGKPDPDPPGLLGDFLRYNFLTRDRTENEHERRRTPSQGRLESKPAGHRPVGTPA
jgi:N-acetylglucosaminyl-diphospho-decaprenol L-rhamnosyltransferase